MKETYFTVGVIANTHGLRGEVKVLARTDFPEVRFKAGSKLFLRQPGQTPTREVVVGSGRQQKNVWIVAFQGVGSISEVEHWKGLELCVDESRLQPLPEGTYYVHQLLGLRVVTDEGQDVGEIVDVLTPGANDVYVVRGNLQTRDVLIPAIPDCVLAVDLERKTMRIHLLPGLLEANGD